MIGFDPAHRDTNGKVRITEREPAWASEPVDRRFVKKYDDDDDHGARRMFGGFTLEYLLELSDKRSDAQDTDLITTALWDPLGTYRFALQPGHYKEAAAEALRKVDRVGNASNHLYEVRHYQDIEDIFVAGQVGGQVGARCLYSQVTHYVFSVCAIGSLTIATGLLHASPDASKINRSVDWVIVNGLPLTQAMIARGARS